MSSDVVNLPSTPAMQQADFIGQATAVEQARAVAEVQAAIVVARQCPRDVQAALSAMRESCQQRALADRAFFKFPRAGGSVTGPSIHLARELARCWGNIQYGIAELRRDDDAGFSEIQAFAWDIQTNTRSAHVFIVPHKRDKRGGPERLVELRDIYENNANNGARRVREAIFAVLPTWLIEEAKDICVATLSDGGGKSLAQRIADAVKMYEGIGITREQLETKIGRPISKWTEHDFVQIGIAFKSLQRGEIVRDEEFPPQRVTAAEIEGRSNGESQGH